MQQSFPNSLESIPKARHFAKDVLNGFPESMIESATLVVSELATNCLRHAHSGFEVDVDIDNQCAHISVTDAGGGRPQMQTPKPTDTSGRGLRIVDLLSNEWGIIPASTARGKTVWFRLCI